MARTRPTRNGLASSLYSRSRSSAEWSWSPWTAGELRATAPLPVSAGRWSDRAEPLRQSGEVPALGGGARSRIQPPGETRPPGRAARNPQCSHRSCRDSGCHAARSEPDKHSRSAEVIAQPVYLGGRRRRNANPGSVPGDSRTVAQGRAGVSVRMSVSGLNRATLSVSFASSRSPVVVRPVPGAPLRTSEPSVLSRS